MVYNYSLTISERYKTSDVFTSTVIFHNVLTQQLHYKTIHVFLTKAEKSILQFVEKGKENNSKITIWNITNWIQVRINDRIVIFQGIRCVY